MSYIRLGTVSGAGLGTPPVGKFFEFFDSDNLDSNGKATFTTRDDAGNDTTYDASNKRDLTAQKNSIEDDGGDLQLVGDQSAPAINNYYGTDQSGNKGFYPIPTASGVQSVTGDGVGGTASNPVLTFPTPAEIGAKPDFTENTAFNKDFGTASGEVMDAGTYDPNTVGADAFDYGNFLGTFQIGGSITSVNLLSDIDNLNVNGFNIVRLTSGSQDRRITGIVAPPSGENRVICFLNESSQYRIVFVHQSGSSSVNNRIVLRGAASTRNLWQFQVAFAIYNHNLNKWHITRIA